MATTQSSYRQQQIIDWQQELTLVNAQITGIGEALSQGLTSASTQEYTFDSGTGRQTEKFRSPLELFSLQRSLVARRELLRRLLAGRGIYHQQTRPGGSYYTQIESDYETTS